MAIDKKPSINIHTLKANLDAEEQAEKPPSNHIESLSNNSSSFENTGFNVISLIKNHLSHSEPAMFFIIHYYVHFRRIGRINRALFWIISYLGQLIDMAFSILWTLLKAIVLIGIILAVLRGLGLDTFIIDFLRELKTI